MSEENGTSEAKPIVVYDGHCNLCNRSLQFLLKHDRQQHFIYVPFQSPQGQAICDRFGIEFTESTSMLLLENQQLFTHSQAWQRILGRLSFGFRLLSLLIRVLPAALCDRVYEFIGGRRYRWFGKTEACQLVEQGALPELSVIERRLPSNPQQTSSSR